MTPHELTAHRACSLGMRAELNVLEFLNITFNRKASSLPRSILILQN